MENKRKKRGGLRHADKRLNQAYREMMKEIRTKVKIGIEDFSNTPDVKKTDKPIKNDNIKRNKIKPSKALEEAIRKQNELKKRRRALSVPAKRVLPFDRKLKDFQKDEDLEFLLQQKFSKAPNQADCVDELANEMDGLRVSGKEKLNSIDDLLLVMPLRFINEQETDKRNQGDSSQLPPIYRREFWKQNIICNRGRSFSIPSKNNGNLETQFVSMTLNNHAMFVIGENMVTRRPLRRSLKAIRLTLNASKYRQLRREDLELSQLQR